MGGDAGATMMRGGLGVARTIRARFVSGRLEPVLNDPLWAPLMAHGRALILFLVEVSQ
jgi:hypothetical protein